MVYKALEEEFLLPLSSQAFTHRVVLYASYVVLSIRPNANDIGLTLDILHLFGETLGPRTNVNKSHVLQI
jgi:hypothetical protein